MTTNTSQEGVQRMITVTIAVKASIGVMADR
jgi:hypothetical protein